MSQNTERIRALNDKFRTSLSGGKVTWTAGIDGFSDPQKTLILERVRTFDRERPVLQKAT